MKPAKNTRKRGDELLENLFESTLKLVRNDGLINLSFQAIAEAAKTSRTVLYRRWETSFDLLQDVYGYKVAKMFDPDLFSDLKNTGSLRTDLLQLLRKVQGLYTEIGAETINNYIFLRAQDRKDRKEPAAHTAAARNYLHVMQQLLGNAAASGESVRRVSKQTLVLPFHLIRMENLLPGNRISERRLTTMVDEVLLPVYLKS